MAKRDRNPGLAEVLARAAYAGVEELHFVQRGEHAQVVAIGAAGRRISAKQPGDIIVDGAELVDQAIDAYGRIKA